MAMLSIEYERTIDGNTEVDFRALSCESCMIFADEETCNTGEKNEEDDDDECEIEYTTE